METYEIIGYAILFGLNVLFGWLGSRWVARKGYPEWRMPVLLISIFTGAMMPLMVISFLPGRARKVPRRSLHRKLPPARMPQPRVES